MNHQHSTSTNSNRQSANRFLKGPLSAPGNPDIEIRSSSSSSISDLDLFIGKGELLEKFKRQLKQFEEWHQQRDWLAFHHHHYDWWAFPSELVNIENMKFPSFISMHSILSSRSYLSTPLKSLRRCVYKFYQIWSTQIFTFSGSGNGILPFN